MVMPTYMDQLAALAFLGRNENLGLPSSGPNLFSYHCILLIPIFVR